tara:strand:- start:725 stop:1168 length:444 start_codon:yes stop_codon:yes gene_type:complete
MTKMIRLTSSNYHPAYEIHRQGHSHPWSESMFADCFTEQYRAYGLVLEDSYVGLYVALFVLDEATLMDIDVAMSFRGRGLSKQLMAHFLQQCKSKGMQSVWLEVRASNLAAIGLYQKEGFVLIERRKSYYEMNDGREDALIMKLTLV